MKRRMKRLEELSSSSLTLDEVDEVNQNESMWRICGEVLMKLLTGWGKSCPYLSLKRIRVPYKYVAGDKLPTQISDTI